MTTAYPYHKKKKIFLLKESHWKDRVFYSHLNTARKHTVLPTVCYWTSAPVNKLCWHHNFALSLNTMGFRSILKHLKRKCLKNKADILNNRISGVMIDWPVHFQNSFSEH